MPKLKLHLTEVKNVDIFPLLQCWAQCKPRFFDDQWEVHIAQAIQRYKLNQGQHGSPHTRKVVCHNLLRGITSTADIFR